MGKPSLFWESVFDGWERPELKHLSRGRKRNYKDCVSKRRAKAQKPKPWSQDRGVAGQTIWDRRRIVERSGKTGQRA